MVQVVVGHHPLFSAGHHGSAKETAPLRAALLPLLARYGVDLYACGHDHIAQHVVPTGGGGAGRPPPASSAATQEGEEEREQATEGMDASYSSTPRARYAAAEGWERGPGPGRRPDLGARRQQSAHRNGTRAGAPPRTTDHVTIGTSGPMVMPGEFDFEFENGGAGPSQFGVVEEAPEDGKAGSVDDGYEDSVRPGLGFELRFATKRRAFGVVEAGEDSLRVSLVGKDGNVLYSFDRSRYSG